MHGKPNPSAIMKRFHVHLRVNNLEESIAFYTALFNTNPSVEKPDYAKWMLNDPRINFAISTNPDGEKSVGIRHLGIQTENETELKSFYEQMETAKGNIFKEGATTCCYAESDKSWIEDPQGVAWEVFLTHGAATVYGAGKNARRAPEVMNNWNRNDNDIPPSHDLRTQDTSPCCDG